MPRLLDIVPIIVLVVVLIVGAVWAGTHVPR